MQARTIVITGGGFSGSIVAAQLLRRSRTPTRVVLFERNGEPGGGVAYGAAGDGHLLNVPAGRMGAWPDAVDDFYRWVRTLVGFADVGPGEFLPRRIFEAYIRHCLREAQRRAGPDVVLEQRRAEVFDIEELSSGGARVFASDVKPVDADHVVLALGNLPGEYPLRKPLPFYHGPRYVHAPWSRGALDSIERDDEILLVGQGLTAVDIILSLEGRGHRGVIHALSRRGLRPLAHQACEPYPRFLEPTTEDLTIRGLLRRVRMEVRSAAARGIDWRGVVDSLRSNTQALWLRLPHEERARFLRHLRPYWEVHRHRIAPKAHQRLEALLAAGRVLQYAGRVEALVDEETHAAVTVRRRKTGELLSLRVAKVINCTGPRSDYTKYQHPLLVNLLARGLIDHDPLTLGLATTPEGEVLRYQGGPVGWLSTLGPPMRGVLWECSAVPEIRIQAEVLAQRLLCR
ncbi:MAG: FAD/NAD(P)-binding protein [Opitutaceae bacterium]|nr:FAD/NAD(P)-binding protein [Opitutaceae bacterium]